MTVEEFSNQWDLYYNNSASNAAPGLDEYEKSIYLTEAQQEVVLGLYNGTIGSGFENTELNRKYLNNLVATKVLTNADEVSPSIYDGGLSSLVYNESSQFFKLPEDLLVLTYEAASVDNSINCINNRTFEVIPTTQDEYRRVKDNPFRGANNKRILRFDVENNGNNNVVELISKHHIDEYTIRYLRKPKPIILTDLSLTGDTIDGYTQPSTSELNPILHQIILETAINKAYQLRPR